MSSITIIVVVLVIFCLIYYIRGLNKSQAKSLEVKDAEIEVLQKTIVTLRKLSLTDPLTGLGNRRAFDDSIKKYDISFSFSAEGDRRKSPTLSLKSMGILMIDIDNFKRINDNQGHDVGDAILKQVAVIISETFARAADIVARYGGEEFIVALIDVSADELKQAAEKVREKIAATSFSTGQTSKLEVTISVGAAHTDKPIDLNKLIISADKAMYVAKNNGRDQVSIGTNEL